MIYVDPLVKWGKWNKTGGSCHLASDTSEAELQAFACKIGLLDEWFQPHPLHPHYDLSANMRRRTVAAGALEVSASVFVKKCSRVFNPAITAEKE